MPLYMDLHNLEDGTTAEQLEADHNKDVAVQEKYGVNYLTYWFNDAAGKVFCLVDAPSIKAAVAVHREAHGQLADEIIEVESRDVSGFLGDSRYSTPAMHPGQFSALDPAVRTIFFTDLEGSTSFTQRLGDVAAMELVHSHDSVVRGALSAHHGQEVKHTGDGIMAAFGSAARAVDCAIQIQQTLAADSGRLDHEPIHVRIGMSAGEPVAEHQDLFGAAVQLARRVCDSANPDQNVVSNVIRELCIGKRFAFGPLGDRSLKGFDEPVSLYEVRWQ